MPVPIGCTAFASSTMAALATVPIRPMSGLTSAQRVELMDYMGMSSEVFSAFIRAQVKETGTPYELIVKKLWEAKELA